MNTYMTVKGQVVIPSRIRRQLGVTEGTRIQVEVTASHFVAGRREGRDDIIVQCTELTTDADADALVDAVAQLARSGETVAAR